MSVLPTQNGARIFEAIFELVMNVYRKRRRYDNDNYMY